MVDQTLSKKFLHYITNHPGIGRGSLAQHFKIPPAVAASILHSLRVAGLLLMHGSRRGATYQTKSAR